MSAEDSEDEGFAGFFVTSQDGLKLHGRSYGPRASDHVAVVCLAGLTRNSRDFHRLALFLAENPSRPRRVIALDYRGRGESESDRNWANYDPRVEAQDALDFLTAIGVHEAIFIGTSRGGLVIYALAALRPSMIRAAILNDIGPVIDARGLIRIRSYVGKLPAPNNFDEGADILKHLSDAQFTALGDEEWRRQARNTWREENGKLTPRYDAGLMKGLAQLDLEKPLPPLWPLFMALKDIPVLAIRGANSDLLAAETLSEMAKRHPDCESFTVPGQGHAPTLEDAPTLTRIETFIARVDARLKRAA